MNISDKGIQSLKEFEGWEPTAYKDIAGIWTIGWGHTGPEVREGMTIDEEQGTTILRADLARFEGGVRAVVKVHITQSMFDALVCFAYNVGPAALRSSTAIKRLNMRDYTGAAEALTWWNKARVGGVLRVVPGLVNRRNAEVDMFLSDGLPTEGHEGEIEEPGQCAYISA